MKTIAQLEAESNAAHQARDAADKREAALHAIVAAFRAVNLADDNEALTDEDRAIANAADMAITPHYIAVLKALRLLGEQIRGPLTDAVNAADRALNDAPEEAA